MGKMAWDEDFLTYTKVVAALHKVLHLDDVMRLDAATKRSHEVLESTYKREL